MEWDWVRIKTDIINDPKLRRYFSKAERWDWTTLMCLAAKSRERGVILLTDEEISYALDMEDADWTVFEAKLCERRMVHRREEDGALVLTNWDRHQYEKPSDTPARVKERVTKHRANRALGTDNSDNSDASKPDSTLQSPESQDETPKKRDVTPCNTLEQQSRAKSSLDKSSSSVDESLREDPEPALESTGAPPPSLLLPPAADKSIDFASLPDRRASPKAFAEAVLRCRPGWLSPLEKRYRDAKADLVPANRPRAEWPWKATILADWAAGIEDPPAPPGPISKQAVGTSPPRENAAAYREFEVPKDAVSNGHSADAKALTDSLSAKLSLRAPPVPGGIDGMTGSHASRSAEQVVKAEQAAERKRLDALVDAELLRIEANADDLLGIRAEAIAAMPEELRGNRGHLFESTVESQIRRIVRERIRN